VFCAPIETEHPCQPELGIKAPEPVHYTPRTKALASLGLDDMPRTSWLALEGAEELRRRRRVYGNETARACLGDMIKPEQFDRPGGRPASVTIAQVEPRDLSARSLLLAGQESAWLCLARDIGVLACALMRRRYCVCQYLGCRPGIFPHFCVKIARNCRYLIGECSQ